MQSLAGLRPGITDHQITYLPSATTARYLSERRQTNPLTGQSLPDGSQRLA